MEGALYDYENDPFEVHIKWECSEVSSVGNASEFTSLTWDSNYTFHLFGNSQGVQPGGYCISIIANDKEDSFTEFRIYLTIVNEFPQAYDSVYVIEITIGLELNYMF